MIADVHIMVTRFDKFSCFRERKKFQRNSIDLIPNQM